MRESNRITPEKRPWLREYSFRTGDGTTEIGLFKSFPVYPPPGRDPSCPAPDSTGVDHQTITRKVPLGEAPFADQFSGWSRQTLL
jgi:hypothetical protein